MEIELWKARLYTCASDMLVLSLMTDVSAKGRTSMFATIPSVDRVSTEAMTRHVGPHRLRVHRHIVGIVVVEALMAVKWQRHGRSRTCLKGWVGAEHCDAGSEFRATKGHHMLPDMLRDGLTVVRICVDEDELDKVVSVLIPSNVD